MSAGPVVHYLEQLEYFARLRLLEVAALLACPVCARHAGELCRTPSGKLLGRPFHAARLARAHAPESLLRWREDLRTHRKDEAAVLAEVRACALFRGLQAAGLLEPYRAAPIERSRLAGMLRAALHLDVPQPGDC